MDSIKPIGNPIIPESNSSSTGKTGGNANNSVQTSQNLNEITAQLANSGPADNTAQINALKNALKNNTYAVDHQQLADNLVEEYSTTNE